MEAYTDFAYLYDIFMEDVPYEEWGDFLDSLIKAYKPDSKSLLDMGCGTGILTLIMDSKGYELVGADISEDMLCVASERAEEEERELLFICQDMRELSLLEPVDVIYSFCDCINYLITDEDVISCFLKVASNLKKDGLFIFDFNTVYKYETVIGDTTIAENREDCSFIWENYYSPEDHINEYDVTFFVREEGMENNLSGEDEGLFRRFTETHIQRGYEISEIKKYIEMAGLSFITAIDEESKKSVTEQSERIYVIARRK